MILWKSSWSPWQGGNLAGAWGMGLGRQWKTLQGCLWERGRSWGFPAGPRRAQDATSREGLFSWQPSPEASSFGVSWSLGCGTGAVGLSAGEGACGQAWTFSKSFGDVWSWVGEAQGKICQLDQLLCALPSLLLMLGPQPWQFPPIHAGCAPGEGITRLLCTPESPESTLLVKILFFSSTPFMGKSRQLLPFQIFSDASGCECPHEAWRVGKWQYLLSKQNKNEQNKKSSWDRICKPDIYTNPGKKQDCGYLTWNNPSTKNRTESWPQDLLLTHLLESWRTAKMCENRGVLKFNFGFLREQEAPQTPWLQWVLAVLTTELLPGWALFFFPSENANSLQWKHCRIVSLLWLCERSQAVFLPNSLAPHSPPWQDLQSQRASILQLTLHPIPTPQVPPCSMAKLLLACKGKQWCNFLLPQFDSFLAQRWCDFLCNCSTFGKSTRD